MRRIRQITAFSMAIAIMFSGTAFASNAGIDGMEQRGAESADVTNQADSAPLSHLKDYFVNSPMFGLVWKWNLDYIWEQNPEADSVMNEKYHHTGTKEIQVQEALAMNSTLPLDAFSPRGLLAVAELAGVSTEGDATANAERARIDALKKEILAFMNSFDWKNASDFEKAVRISERIAQAEYYDDTTYGVNDFGQQTISWGDASREIGCLVDGKANCDGMTNAACLLAKCVGLESFSDIIGNHGFPIYRINGIWVRHEPTTKDRFFRIFDWEASKYGPNKEYYSSIAEFCERSGYVTPTNEEVLAAFPGKAHQPSENKVIIYFD